MSRPVSRVGSAPRAKEVLSIGLCGVCLAAIAFVAPRASGRTLLLAAAVLVAPVLAQRSRWGLVLLIPAALAVRFSVGTGTGTPLPAVHLLLVALLALWLLEMLQHGSWQIAASPANLPLVVFLCMAGVALAAGNALWNPLVGIKSNLLVVQLAQWAVFALSAGAFWLSANLVDDTRYLKWMVALFSGLGALYLGQSLLATSANPISQAFEGGGTGSLFWVWLVAMAGGQALFNTDLAWPLRLGLGGLTVATIVTAWIQAPDWVSGWGPSLLAGAVLLWQIPGRWRAGVRIGLVLVILLFGPQFYRTSQASAIEAGSFLRVDAWRGIAQLVGARWPIGLGLAAYVFYWNDLIGYWAYSPTNVVRLADTSRVNSHNNYMDIFAQMGALGLLVLLWLAVALWRQVQQAKEVAPAGFERAYACGCAAGLAGSLAAGMLGDWLLPFVYNIGLPGMRASLLMWLFLGGAVAIQKLHTGSVGRTDQSHWPS